LNNDGWRFAHGDLVEFKSQRLTEEYIDELIFVGIVVDRSYRFTTDNRYKILVRGREHWTNANSLTLISQGRTDHGRNATCDTAVREAK
jgi:hypothetical protein